MVKDMLKVAQIAKDTGVSGVVIANGQKTTLRINI